MEPVPSPMSVFPPVRIETPRLVVREFGPHDAPGVTLAVAAAEREALPPGAPPEPAGVWRWLGHGVHRWRTDGNGVHLAVEERATGDYAGAMTLFNTDWPDRATEVGFGLRRGHRGRGYATEALTVLTEWVLFETGVRRVDLMTDPANTACCRVARKSGYTPQGEAVDPVSGRTMLLFTAGERGRTPAAGRL